MNYEIYLPYPYTVVDILLEDARAGKINISLTVSPSRGTATFKIDPHAKTTNALAIWEALQRDSDNQL